MYIQEWKHYTAGPTSLNTGCSSVQPLKRLTWAKMTRSGQGHHQSTDVSQVAHVLGAYKGKDDVIILLALEAIHWEEGGRALATSRQQGAADNEVPNYTAYCSLRPLWGAAGLRGSTDLLWEPKTGFLAHLLASTSCRGSREGGGPSPVHPAG